MTKTVLAIDPGSSRCGLALVQRSEANIEILHNMICSLADLESGVLACQEVQSFALVIVGSGTRSREVVTRLRELIPAIGTMVVDETNTSNEARARYWEHNPRRGWRRLLPATLQVPPVPIDDYSALILAERVLGE